MDPKLFSPAQGSAVSRSRSTNSVRTPVARFSDVDQRKLDSLLDQFAQRVNNKSACSPKPILKKKF